ncbi:MAG TPA: polysaccharide deacetylase family protein [Paralcaligenes sp.]|jgi:Predicted xylanase/chitin deacetylase
MKAARAVPVLMYHHVSPSEGMITTSPVNFERQLAWLRRHGYRSLTGDGFAKHLAGGPTPPRSILITFDDGYLDNWVYAYPLLKRYGFNAMVFLVTSWIGEGLARPCLGQGDLPETPSHRECEARIQRGARDEVMLRWAEVKTMLADGVFEFHSHTHSHTRWDKSDQADHKNTLMAEELALSRKTLSEHLGRVSSHLCWPQGYFDADYIELARQAGFRYLYTTNAFGQNRAGMDPAFIYRFAVRNTSRGSFGRRIWIAADPWFGPLFNQWKLWKRSRRRQT